MSEDYRRFEHLGFAPRHRGLSAKETKAIQKTRLLAVLPFYLPMVGMPDLRLLRALRLLRTLRLLKRGRYSQAIQTIARVVVVRKEGLTITVFVVFILLLVGSAGFSYAEHEAQPQEIPSIPAAMWWGVVTLSLVGYADIVPLTQVTYDLVAISG
jgi:voltage-gated potassium channel